MASQDISKIKSVAIIGAGISGISAAAHLLLAGLDVTVFERSGVLGGVWHYDARRPLTPPFPNVAPPDATSQYKQTPTGLTADEASVYHASPGPCYAGLRNNFDSAVMRSSLLEWPEGTEGTMAALGVKHYIESLAQTYDLVSRVRLWTRVEAISKPVGASQWNLRSQTFSQAAETFNFTTNNESFDAVVVASGHYDIPRVPDIAGLANWKSRFPDRVTHSKRYRVPSDFKNSTVLIIGAGVSAYDIARELDAVGCKTYQASRDPSRADRARLEGMPESCERVPGVSEFILDETVATSGTATSPLEETQTIPGRVLLTDGRDLKGLHHVILATGYVTTYPFLGELEQPTLPVHKADNKVIITADGSTVHNLHLDIFYIPDPTLCFIGVPVNTSTFSLFDFQARILARVWKGEARLPPQQEMQRIHMERKARLKPGDKFHSLALQDLAYAEGILKWVNADLEEAGLQPLTAFDDKWHEGFKALRAFVESVRPDLDLTIPLVHTS
ncbi:hypothetical protein BKA64DRAFT_57784 [Cadophora sp. MPI-SDFR-AT-0126]|nr:hypothetical protein BKA64DRAFT_57784 [Leotiomycetes sp. MPI-SDFR-AT-0126]